MGSFTIVAFCGGGIRGLMSAGILQRLAERNSSILRNTDLFAGTSTGSGIISMLLARKSPADIVNYFLNNERKFFTTPQTDRTKPAYSVDEVAASQVLMHGDKTLRDFDQKVLFTSFNVGAKYDVTRNASVPLPWTPRLFNNLKDSDTADTRIADAVTSSSAMPGMLGSWKGNIDGAFVNHDPTLAAIALAISRGVRLEDIAVICIGTGLMFDHIGSDTKTWGAWQWQNGDHDAHDQTPPFLINGTASPILDVALNATSTMLTPTLAAMMLPGRYACLNPVLPYTAENDVTQEAIDRMQQQAANADIGPATDLLNTHWSKALTAL